MSPSCAPPLSTETRTLLQTLCAFIQALPSIHATDWKATADAEVPVEAGELIAALEDFISGSRKRKKSKVIEVAFQEDTNPYEILEDLISEDSESNITGKKTPSLPVRLSTTTTEPALHVSRMAAPIAPKMEDHTVPMAPSLKVDLKLKSHFYNLVLYRALGTLQTTINERMPLRVLYFHPSSDSSRLKISLVEKGDIIKYLAPKMLEAYERAPYSERLRMEKATEFVRYAILSHTWAQTPAEMSYDAWHNGTLAADDPRMQKIASFCKAAWKDYGLSFGWIDTVCINKESSSELDESIRSMYKWYSTATVCITYLAETTDLSDMARDRWFTRGWTLQELIAPTHVKFYNMSWIQLAGDHISTDKADSRIQEVIQEASGIAPTELISLRNSSISRRMELAASRLVTREEDMAYSLMGIFDVSISTAYGEGVDHAFFRIMKEIFDSTKDPLDMFNWAGRYVGHITSMFPYRPAAFVNRSTKYLRPWHPIKPLRLTHLGLRIPVLLMPAVLAHRPGLPQHNKPLGSYHAFASTEEYWGLASDYHLLDECAYNPTDCPGAKLLPQGTTRLTFGVVNVEAHESTILIPKTCLAVSLLPLDHQDGAIFYETYTKVVTSKPLVFNLWKSGDSKDTPADYYYEVERSELESHGMRLKTLDL